jgi:ribulose bisphosphate carboxylase small subunit
MRADSEGRASYDEILPGCYVRQFGADGVGEARVLSTLAQGDNSLEVRLESN